MLVRVLAARGAACICDVGAGTAARPWLLTAGGLSGVLPLFCRPLLRCAGAGCWIAVSGWPRHSQKRGASYVVAVGIGRVEPQEGSSSFPNGHDVAVPRTCPTCKRGRQRPAARPNRSSATRRCPWAGSDGTPGELVAPETPGEGWDQEKNHFWPRSLLQLQGAASVCCAHVAPAPVAPSQGPVGGRRS